MGCLLFASLVEVLQKVALPPKFDFFVVGEPAVTLHCATTHRRDHIKDHTAPNVAILDIVKAFA